MFRHFLKLFFFLFTATIINADSHFFLSDSLAKKDSLSADSLAFVKSDSLAQPQDTLRPIQYKSILVQNEYGNRLNKKAVNRTDYRYTGDILNQVPFGFLRDLGSVGQPSELFIYGMGNGNISFLQDGVDINSRYQNTLDLNLFQSESIDSIEVLPLPVSFIYNKGNNPVTVNFITRDRINTKPYSRVRFYQAPEDEGYIDGLFSVYLLDRVNTSFQFTNQGVQSRYTNSELSNWNLNTKVRYMPSNLLNVVGTYNYSKLNMDLNGGVDFESLPPGEQETLLYSNLEAPVIYEDRYHKTTRHNFSIKFLTNLIENNFTDLDIYYQYYLNEFRQNENEQNTDIPLTIHNNSYKSFGIKLRNLYRTNFLSLELIGGYDRNDYDIDYIPLIKPNDILSIAGRLGLNLFNDRLIPSFYVKYSNIDDEGLKGFGGDLNFRLFENIRLYAGYSTYEKVVTNTSSDLFISNSSKNNIQEIITFEAGTNFSYEFLKGSVSYFRITYSNYILGLISNVNDTATNTSIGNYSYIDFERSGLNANLQFNLWKFQLNSNTSFYFDESQDIQNKIPEFTSFGGFYYVDSLFNGNLDLKAGLNYKFYGYRDYLVYDFEKLQPSYYYYNFNEAIQKIGPNQLIEPSLQLDLFISGRIREKAIIFLVFENMFNDTF